MGTLRIAGIVKESYVDGPGIRYTIFTQGCPHHCFKCQNPETWDIDKGTLVDIDKLIEDIQENPLLDGVTLSGGDPLIQDETLELVQKLKERTNLNIWCYTGYSYEEVLNNDKFKKILNYIDVLIDGEYVDSLRSLSLLFRGSSNQRLIDIKKSLEQNKIIEYKN